ncbi:hypothetical protein OFY01_10285, partial [Streptomyces sp. GXMU-J5]|nr:hypothetical protein [Streptomyces beihaiensis]
GHAALETARRGLAGALVELRGAADTAAGEWWQRALPEERVVAAERSGHRTLAATILRQTPRTGAAVVGDTGSSGVGGPIRPRAQAARRAQRPVAADAARRGPVRQV